MSIDRGFLMALAVATGLCATAAEWRFAENADPALKVQDAPELRFPDGFKATLRVSVDLARTTRSAFQNLFTKGRDFHDGYSVMVNRDGRLLVDVYGVEPQYYLTPFHLESNRAYDLEVYVMKDKLRLFVDGTEKGSVPYRGTPAYATNAAPLKIGSTGGYAFFGTLAHLKLEPLDAVAIPPGGPTPLLDKAPDHQPLADVLWTRPICREPDRYIGWATAVCTRKGTIVAAFSGDRDAHVCPWGKNQVVRSEDGGETWSAPITVNNSIADDRDCGLVELPDGELLCTWFTDHTWDQLPDYKNPKPGSPQVQWRRHVEKLPKDLVRAACGIWCSRSRDDGRTWSKPEKYERPAPFSPHGPVVLKDGSLVWMGRSGYREPEKKGLTRVSCSHSADGGRSWQERCYALPDQNGENAKPAMFHEPHAIELVDGRLLALVRYHGEDNCLRQSFSSDGGRTWTPMAKTPMLGLPPHLLRLQDGRILCTYGRRFPQPVGYGEFACLSSDEGRTWDAAREIFLSAAPNGDLVTVYYQVRKLGEKPCLMATKWKIRKQGF